MMNQFPRTRRLLLLRRFLLALAVLTTAAAVVGFAFAGYLFLQGYSGGGDPQSVAGLAFPIAFLVLAMFCLPAGAVCAATWAGYRVAARRSRELPR